MLRCQVGVFAATKGFDAACNLLDLRRLVQAGVFGVEVELIDREIFDPEFD